jgi:chromosome segregation protein
LTGALATLQQSSAAAAEERTRAEGALATARREHGARLADRDGQRARKQRLSGAVALARQEAATAEATRARAAGVLAEAERDMVAKEAQRSRLTGEATALAEGEARAADRRERVLAQVGSLGEALEPARGRVAEMRAERAAREAAVARQEGEHSGLATAARAAEDAQARAVRDLEALTETVEADLGLALEELPEPDGPPPAAGRLRSLRARLAEFGAVNQRAVADHESTAARLAFLREQVRDLEEGLVLLREVIDEANASVRAQFGSTVARLEEHFAVYFRQLFAGGSCGLQALYDATGMPSGLEVRAQPPGKRAQDLALLSGGERALVALALLFAMLAVRPVPFCLLDEVEAALDESNTGRFADILRSLSGSTQFVLITHNRGTMVQADSLYGITMGEAGTSQMASLALRDVAADRYAGPRVMHGG